MKAIIEKFYTAFENLDGVKMAECYHPEIIFEDPAFGKLKGERAKKMWMMLCKSQKGKDFKIIFSDIKYEKGKGTAKWDAFYTFSQTGRKVHNEVFASFEFKDNLIVKHYDDFNLHKWAKQAMGFKGFLLGGTAYFKSKLQEKTNKLLNEFVV
jgi:hypothetical protein